jgi:hypothetical protein
MFTNLKTFILGESGAVTVDWVVLTAAIGLMGFLIISTVASGAVGHANDTGTYLAAIQPGP